MKKGKLPGKKCCELKRVPESWLEASELPFIPSVGPSLTEMFTWFVVEVLDTDSKESVKFITKICGEC